MTLVWQHLGTQTDNGPTNGSEILYYEVERKEEETDWFPVGRTPPGERYFDYKEVYPLKTIRIFRVRARNSVGFSQWVESSEIVLRRLTEAEKHALKKKERSVKVKLKGALRLAKKSILAKKLST